MLNTIKCFPNAKYYFLVTLFVEFMYLTLNMNEMKVSPQLAAIVSWSSVSAFYIDLKLQGIEKY